MTRFGWLVVGGAVLAALGIALLLWGFARRTDVPVVGTDVPTRSPVVDPATLSIYTNGVYGFSLFYPATATVTDSFTSSTTFPWRSSSTASGTPIVKIVTAAGEVRIGATTDERSRTSCGIAGPSEHMADPLVIASTTWKAFTFDELGTDNERHVTSYRTVHAGQCFAIETFKPIASGEEPAPTEDLGFIVRNFTFAR